MTDELETAMTRFGTILAIMVLTAFLSAATAEAQFTISWVPGPFANINRHSSPSASASSGLRRQVNQAQTELTKAYAAANRNDPLADDLKTAQANLNKARQDYAALVAAERAKLAQDPAVAAMVQDVRDAEDRLAGEKDLNTRLAIANELMAARNKLNAAQGDVMGLDPDVAIAKKNVDDALSALQTIQAKRQQQIQNDPAVQAARQNLANLRQQFAKR